MRKCGRLTGYCVPRSLLCGIVCVGGFSMIDSKRLESKLLHTIAMEKRSATRVKRAATLLHKWSANRRRIEKKIGQAEVQRIINRLSLGVTDSDKEN